MSNEAKLAAESNFTARAAELFDLAALAKIWFTTPEGRPQVFNRIDYRFTVTDPATWTMPWSTAMTWYRAAQRKLRLEQLEKQPQRR